MLTFVRDGQCELLTDNRILNKKSQTKNIFLLIVLCSVVFTISSAYLNSSLVWKSKLLVTYNVQELDLFH